MNDYRGRPLIQVEVEERIQGLCDALEELVTTFTSVSHKRAEAEADFKYRYSRSSSIVSGKYWKPKKKQHNKD